MQRRSLPKTASSPTLSLLAALACLALAACGDDGGGGGGAGTGGAALDACSIVTQADATALFGQPAVRESQNSTIVDPALLGECLWGWDTDTSSQLLQFYVWNGAAYHSSAPAGSEPLAVGQQGYISVNESLGIDAEWLEGDRTIVLSYFNIGSDVPEYATVLEPMKALAQKVSDAL